MMSCDFQITTHGKWILAGEHAVLRGHGALVFPVLNKQLKLTYQAGSHTKLTLECTGLNAPEMQLLLSNVLQRGQQLLEKPIDALVGHFHLQNNIPIGVGLGASAALCAAVANWFDVQNQLPESVYSFAKNLEHLFHGNSSGVDIIGACSEGGMYFQQGQTNPIKQAWKPHWFLSSSDQIGITSHCINQVQELWQKNPITAARIDEEMQQAVMQAKCALEKNEQDSLDRLTHSIQQATHCFQQWGLVNNHLQKHMHMLLDLGALAVKPTGSGKGGYVISLWKTQPSLPSECIAV